ncbi:Beta-glucuronosyltransferase GlcAT14B [Linum grandiflorum]
MGIIKLSMISFILITLLYSSFLLYFPSPPSRPTATSSPPRAAAVANTHLLLHRPYPVRFAYLISASRGDFKKLSRLIKALYHPANYYLIHLDSDAPPPEHRLLSEFISGEEVFRGIGNVWVVEKPNLVTYRGPTMLATTLHAIAILLKKAGDWDWFVNLSASDYPLVTQDDLIEAFSGLPRNLNFVQHSSRLGWKLNKRAKPIMIDPGLYSNNKSEIWWLNKQRSIPTAFKLYTGSAWTILSRSFAEYTILGYENLPRALLLYYTNFVSSPEGYFQTLICNSREFKNTTANHDLHYIAWDNPPKQHPKHLTLKDYRRMILSGRPFARKFKRDDPVLDRIDRVLLRRSHNKGNFGYGRWCVESDGFNSVGGKKWDGGGCPSLVDIENVRFGPLDPGPGFRRLKSLLGKLVVGDGFTKRQCR